MTPRQLINAQLKRLRKQFTSLVFTGVGLALLLILVRSRMQEDSGQAFFFAALATVVLVNLLWLCGAGFVPKTSRIHCPVCLGQLAIGNPGGSKLTLPEKYHICPYCGVDFDTPIEGRGISEDRTTFLQREDAPPSKG